MRKFKPTGKWGLVIHLSFSLLLLMMTRSYAQETNIITGTITSAVDSKPLSGASVRVKNSGKGTTSDEKGQFSIHAKAGDILEISGVGFQPQQVTVGSASVLTFSLLQAVGGLDEVVVVGYGTQKKKVLTGSTVRVGGDDTQWQPSTSNYTDYREYAAGSGWKVWVKLPGNPPVVTAPHHAPFPIPTYKAAAKQNAPF